MKKDRNYYIFFFCLLLYVFIITFSYNLDAKKKYAFFELLDYKTTDISEWNSKWNVESQAGAELTKKDETFIIKAKLKKQNFAAIYKHITIDLDAFPFLEIDVKKTSAKWFLIFSGEKIKNGYIRIQTDTDKKGKIKYNIKKKLGVKGELSFDLEMGVSVPDGTSCDGEEVIIKDLKFFGPGVKGSVIGKDSGNIDTKDYYDLLSADCYQNMGDWDTRNAEAVLKKIKNKTAIIGKRKNQNYGAIYKNIILNLDDYPYIEIEVDQVSDHWYLILSGDKIKNGYLKIQPDTKKKGKKKYNIKQLLGLSGEINFDLQIGVASPSSKSCDGEKVILKKLKILGVQRKSLYKYDLNIKYVKNSGKISSINPIAFSSTLKKETSPFTLFKSKRKKKNIHTSPITFKETSKELILKNKYYEIGFSAKNGSLLYIKDLSAYNEVSQGTIKSSLWRILYKDKKELYSSLFSSDSSEKNFHHQYSKNDKILRLIYHDKKSSTKISINITGSDEDFFDMKAEIINGGKTPVISAVLPQGLSFNIDSLNHIYYPWKIGVRFNKNFFLEKRFVSEPYPFLFADFVSLDSETGQLSVYMIQKKDSFQQTRLNVGYSSHKNGTGVYEHEFAVYIKKKKKWVSPVLRFQVGNSVINTLKAYAKINKLDTLTSLKEKLGKRKFKAVANGVLLKVDFHWIKQRFSEFEEFMKTLPKYTIVHLVSYWPEGFDKYYPDYLPPANKFGSSKALKRLIKTAHKNDLIVMPYTNPTWWNESPTVSRLGKENIAVRKLDGTIHDEFYGGKNWGIIVSPHHSSVIKRNNQIAKAFTKLKMDILFEDQLGARPWVYDLNPESDKPDQYTQGIINIAKRDSRRIPVMTECGFDRLIPYSVGFCDMSVNQALPPDPIFNHMWGKNNWEVYPFILTKINSKVALYQHNLSHKVFTDKKEKLTWNLAYGHNLYYAKFPWEWEKRKKWFHIADIVQKEIVSHYVGQDLSDFTIVKPNVTWSRFGSIGILANHNKTVEYNFYRHRLASGGFYAQTKNNKIKAGYYTYYNNRLLSTDSLIIEKRLKNSIIINQPTGNSTFISVSRPGHWKKHDWILCYQGNKSIPVAVSDDSITFSYKSTKNRVPYTITYKRPGQSRIIVHLKPVQTKVTSGDKVKLKCIVQNKSKLNIKNAKMILSVIMAKPGHARIRSENKKQVIQTVANLKNRAQWESDFIIQVPSKVQPGDIVWIKGEFQYKSKGKIKKKKAYVDLSVINAIRITYSDYNKVFIPGSKSKINIWVHNISKDKIDCNLDVEGKNILNAWVNTDTKKMYLKRNSKKRVKLYLNIPLDASRRSGFLNAKVKVKGSTVQEIKLPVSVYPVISQVELYPNILMAGKKQKLKVMLRADKSHSFIGSIRITAPDGWVLDKKTQPVKLKPGSIKTLYFKVKPRKGRGSFKITIKSGKKRLTYLRSVSAIKSDEASIVEGDVNGDRNTDIVMGNNKLEFLVSTRLGGRILSLHNRKTGNNQLYTDYPGVDITQGNQSIHWAEYGGINDSLPVAWPGDVWNNEWEYRINKRGPKEVILYTKTKTDKELLLERTITLKANSSKIKLDYIVKNTSDRDIRFTWANHPDMAPGPEKDAGLEDMMIVPTKDKIIKKRFGNIKIKNGYQPAENWCIAIDTNTKEYFAQSFKKNWIQEVGCWEGMVFYTMELIAKEMKLRSGEKKRFTIYYWIGKGDWQKRVKQ